MAGTPGPSTVPLLCKVRVTAGVGIVRFVGQTAFAAGKWIGIELDNEGTGKNDGTVQGKLYFSLRKAGTQSGVFVRPSQVHIIDARPQEAYDEQDEAFDISQDEIQGDLLAENDEVFAVPAPPKIQPKISSRPPSVASSVRSSLVSPTPVTPGTRRLSTRPTSGVPSSSSSARASPTASPRPSLSKSVSGPSAAKSAPRPSLPANRASSTVAPNSTPGPAASALRQHVTAASATPGIRKVSDSLGKTPGAPRTTGLAPPSTPRGPASTAAGKPFLSARKLSSSSVTSQPTSSSMLRGVSSSSSHSSLSSALYEDWPASRTIPHHEIRGVTILPEEDLRQDAALDADDHLEPLDTSPASQASPPQRAAKQSKEESRFSLQSAATGTALDPKQPLTVPARLYEELQMRYKLLENGRSEDRERLKEMERIKEDAEAWNVARPKLQNKMVELSNEVKELRRQVKDTEIERAEHQKKLEDLNDQLEMEMLDKEVAEEKCEVVQNQLEASKERVAELEVELEVLRKEEDRIVREAGQEVEGEADVKSSLAFLQLVKQNERLKEALVRLRDMSTENEQDHKRRIADLEKELDLTSDLQAAFDSTLEQLEQAESTVEHLKLQLDDAMGAEDMLEHLTERNLTLSERIEEMHAVIQDLEALKELNDELEENHVENEQNMQEEIDLKDFQLREYRKQLDNLEDSMLDYEGTISQFRELVINLQNDLEQLREQQQAQQCERATLSSQSQAMLNLNMKLQSTVVRNQGKAVDFELRKFEATQARQHLSMTMPYLPASFHDDDKAAIDALLFFNRLVCKTQVLIHTLEHTHGLQDGNFPETIPDNLVVACETRWRLARFMILCKRFTTNLQRCEATTFVRMGKVHVELLAMEKRIDAFIEASKKQELKETECGDEIDRFLAQAAHVAELHLGESGLDYGEQQLGQALATDLDLDTFIVGVGHAKQALALTINDPDVTIEAGDADIDEVVFTRLQDLIESARSLKTITKKLVRRLEEIAEGSGSLQPDLIETFQATSVQMRSISGFAHKLGDLIAHYTLEVRTSREPFLLSTFAGIIHEAAGDIRSESKDVTGVEVVLRNLRQRLGPILTTAMEQDSVVTTSYEAPWTSRAAELHRNAARDEDAERKVVKLTEDIRDLARELRIKDQNMQESAVKIELLQKRMESGKKQADSAAELEAEVNKLKEQEKEFESTIAQMQQDLDSLERENAKLKQAAPSEKPANDLNIGEYTTFTGSLETSHLVEQIESLRGTVRYLRQQNSHLKSQGLFKEFYTLPTYEAATSIHTNSKKEKGEEAAADRQVRSRSFAEESAVLLREVANFSSRARIVDISKVDSSKAWQPGERQPSAQLAAKRQTLERLKARVDRLAEEKRDLAAARKAIPSIARI